jgi:hypothetical protein
MLTIYLKNIKTVDNSTFYIHFEQTDDADPKDPGMDTVAIILIVICVLLVVCCIGVFVKMYVLRKRDESNNRVRALTIDKIRKDKQAKEDRFTDMLSLMPASRFDPSMDEFKQGNCVICMEDFKTTTMVRKVPVCKHIIHANCLQKWCQGKYKTEDYKCPMCNTDISAETIRKFQGKGPA